MEAKEAIRRIKDFGLYHAIEDLPKSTLTVEAFNKAIELLRLEESGRLVELPCRVGTKRYYIQNNVCINWNDKTNSCPYFRKNKNGEFHQDGCCDCIDREEESRVREHIFTLATMETKYDMFKFENTYETREEAELKLIESKGE